MGEVSARECQPAMGELRFRSIDPESGAEREHALEAPAAGASSTLRFRCLEGASAVHLSLWQADRIRLRAELFSASGEEVTFDLQGGPDGELLLHAPGREGDLSLLSLEPYVDNVPPFVPDGASGKLDLALVFDGTSRLLHAAAEKERKAKTSKRSQPKASQEPWRQHLREIEKLASALAAEGGELRVAVLAFGDHAVEGLKAADLQTDYVLFPLQQSGREFEVYDAERLGARLAAIPPAPGGDFVDALADALQAARQLRWRPEARKLLLVCGDSPGFGVSHAAPPGSDLCVRELDLEVEVRELHRERVELATVYHDSLRSEDPDLLPPAPDLLRHAEWQYRELASRPELSFRLSEWTAEGLCQALADGSGRALGRGAAPGIYLGPG